MNICEKINNSEMRRKMKNEVLPEVIRFTESVFPFLNECDVDKLDRIVVEDCVMADEVRAFFTLEYDPGTNLCTAQGSFYALSADIATCLDSCAVIDNTIPVRDGEIMRAMRKAFSEDNSQNFEISYEEAEDDYDEAFRRIQWTAKLSFSVEDDLLYTSFMYAYNKTIRAIELMYEVYKSYAIEANLVDAYQKLMGMSRNGNNVFELGLTAPIYSRGKLMDEYDSYLVDGFSSLRRIYRSAGPDITSTTICVETVKAEIPSVFITVETLLEEDDGKLDPCDFEYNQSFSVAKPQGDSRSIFHGNDVIARLYYIDPSIYVLEPLSIYFEDENTKYLIITRETDGSFHFFTDKKNEIALLEKGDDSYQATIQYSLKELAPFIVAAEALIFEPDRKQICKSEYDEEKCFRRMNERIRSAKVKMSTWFLDDDYLSLVYDPAANLFSYIKRENNNKGIKKRKLVTYDEVYFVQDTKDRSFGIDCGVNTEMHDGCGLDGNQIRISDFPRCPE